MRPRVTLVALLLVLATLVVAGAWRQRDPFQCAGTLEACADLRAEYAEFLRLHSGRL